MRAELTCVAFAALALVLALAMFLDGTTLLERWALAGGAALAVGAWMRRQRLVDGEQGDHASTIGHLTPRAQVPR